MNLPDGVLGARLVHVVGPVAPLRPLEIRCPVCETWTDAAGIAERWRCPSCSADYPEAVEMRGGLLDELGAAALEPVGVG